MIRYKDGTMTIKAAKLVIDGTVTVSGDVTAGGVSLDNHTHTDSMGGGKPADPTSGSESGEQPDNTASAEDTAGEETDSGDAAPAESSTGTAKAGITDAPLAIVISCKEGSEFDAGLACQNMSAEAQLLGYGTKIISSPTIALNGEEQEACRELLGIPDDQSAVAVLLIGKADTSSDADAVSAETTRKDADEVVTKVSA